MPEWVHIQLDLLATMLLFGWITGSLFFIFFPLYISGIPFAYYAILENRRKSLPEELEVEPWESDILAPWMSTGSWFFYLLALWDNHVLDSSEPTKP